MNEKLHNHKTIATEEYERKEIQKKGKGHPFQKREWELGNQCSEIACISVRDYETFTMESSKKFTPKE